MTALGKPVDCRKANRRKTSGFDDSVGTDAGGADLDGLDGAIVVDSNCLEVGAEGTLRVFHDVHTDTTLLLGKTSTGDVTTNSLVLSANLANSAHFNTSDAIDVTKCFKKTTRDLHGFDKAVVGRPGLEPGTPALKVRCCYRLSYRPVFLQRQFIIYNIFSSVQVSRLHFWELAISN